MEVMTEEQRVAGFGVDASNSTAESVIGASTDMFKVFGTIRAQYCAAIGQTRFNNDFGRAHKELVHGQKNQRGRRKGIPELIPSVRFIKCQPMLKHR